ncbi:MAG: alpha/beta hydrolase [Candidatus Riflebacteria bacterium HGW-Riflebacteria-1]|jgi:haloalkane dehalogenase|nr:MAG: alpha/beta hydrolase [Candidatus Riflebacteria bacterium HGW-Riflebacteria-1]
MTFNHAEYQDIYPFTPHHFTHQSGLKQHYVDEGNGEPIVMVHGNPSWSFLYRDMIRTFMNGYRCVAPDHIGCGLSDKPGLDNFGYTLREHIDNLETLIESLQLTQPINLVVHDWGGAIGMGYATRHPEKIKRMVILNTGAFRLPQDCPFPWPVWLFRNTDLGACLNQTFNAFSFIASHTCSLKGMSRKVRHGFRAPYDSPANRVATTRFVQDIPLVADDPSYTELVRVEENLSKLADKPALICFGRLDFVFTRHFYNEWKRHFPKAIARNFHAGHYLLEDVGSEVFALMRELLESRS